MREEGSERASCQNIVVCCSLLQYSAAAAAAAASRSVAVVELLLLFGSEFGSCFRRLERKHGRRMKYKAPSVPSSWVA